jgi:ElaA protein
VDAEERGTLIPRYCRGDELDPPTLYGLLRLRAEVFVVEQASPYLDPDGHDLDPATVHLWMEGSGGEPVACLRIVTETDGRRRIGRVATAAPMRGRGLAGGLLRHALELAGNGPIVLNAQAHLEGWYRGLGFVPTGPPFDEDGIAHVPMGRG